MKNEGFTLVELLAVILVLAFIAIIAVPQILNLIEESKINSLKLSTESYIRAVNTSLINEEVFNNVKDGLYTIIDDGKKIKLGDKEIYIASEGHGLKSGLLLIEDSKVTRVLKGMIDDYYARVNGEEITILKNLNESTLVAGQDFNKKVKELVGDTIPEGNNKTLLDAVDTTVKSIIFLQDSVLPVGYTKETLQQLKSTDLSNNQDESIKGYYDSDTGTIYVYSDGYISCPTSMQSNFYNFQGVEEIELNLIDTSKVIRMDSMFSNCKSLRGINLIGLDTSKVTRMDSMFNNCSNLTKLDVSHFNTAEVINMSSMFYNCNKLTSLDLINFNTEKVTYMSNMFRDCSSLKKLDLSSFVTKEVMGMGSMFSNCNSLKEIKGLENFDTSKVTRMDSMFNNCSNLTKLDVSHFNTAEVINMSSMFYNCNKLTSLDVSNFNTSRVTNMRGMFNGCNSLMRLDVRNFNTSQVTNMGGMFANCSSLKSLDVSNFDTSKVTSMGGFQSGMFYNCSSLTSIKFGENFNTSNVTTMQDMFQSCSSLEYLDLTSFDTKSAYTGGMFTYCSNLKKIKVTTGKWTLSASSLGLKEEIFEYIN